MKAGVVLDAGAFIALERRDPTMVELARLFVRNRTPLVTPAGVVAQLWRGGEGRQAPVALLLRSVAVADLTAAVARHLGRILGATRTADPTDAHVAFLARERTWAVLSSDVDDLLRIDPTLRVERI